MRRTRAWQMDCCRPVPIWPGSLQSRRPLRESVRQSRTVRSSRSPREIKDLRPKIFLYVANQPDKAWANWGWFWQPRQPSRFALGLAALAQHEAPRVLACPLKAERGEGIDGRLDLGDAPLGGVDQFERRDVAAFEPRDRLRGGQPDELVGYVAKAAIRNSITCLAGLGSMLSALSPCPLVPENSAAAAVALASGPLADIALRDILGHGRRCARRGVTEATPARLDDAHALAGRQLVDGFGMHPHPIDRVFAERSVAAAK